ncbi:MAG: CHASE domain-containing protein [Methylococcaceae bacterium]
MTPPKKNQKALVTLLLSVMVALSYYLAALLGLSLAIPPGYATALWPPSGIALGAVLVWGYRILPGVYLGAFLANLTISLNTATSIDWLPVAANSAGIAIGSTLQAALITLAIKRWVGYPNPLIHNHEVMRFYALSGPLGCLVSASFSMVLLWLTGAISLENLPRNWLTWWLGDAMGVLVFTPIVLALFGKPRGAWRFRRRTLALPLVVSFAVMAGFFVYAQQFETNRQRAELGVLTSTAGDLVQNAVTRHLEELYTVQGLFHATGQVTRDQFERFTIPAIRRNPGIQGFSFNVWVKADQRARFEADQRKSNREDFEITEKNSAGQFVKARSYPDHVVVTYIEPFSSNGKALGYDIGSEPLRRAAIDQAIATGRLSATAPIRLVQETGQQKGILVLLPVRKNPNLSEPDSTGGGDIAGFVVEVLRIGDVIENALSAMGDKRRLVKIEVRDRDAIRGNDFLYTDTGLAATFADALNQTNLLDVGGRRWELTSTVVGEMPGASLNTFYVLLGGAGFTAVLGLLLMTLSGRTLGMEAEVKVRTAELSRKNLRLTEEIRHRQEVEGALRESETRFRSMADSAPVLVFTSTANGFRDYFNRQWQQFTGRLQEPDTYSGWQEVFHPEDLASYLTLITRAAQDQQPYTLNYRLRSASGEYRWFLDSSAPRFGAGQAFMGFISSCIDITDIQKSQAAMQQAKEVAERANTVKSEFMANLSHELLTPMNAILGLSQLLLSDALPEEPRSHLQKIELSARNLLVLLNTLLDFSTLESGQMKIDTAKFSLKDLMGKLIAQTQQAASSQQLELVVKQDSTVPELLMGDSSRLSQVLANLLSNAVKFTERGRIELGCVLEKQIEDSVWITFTVSDTGIGMASEQINSLFSAFSQADGSSTRKYGGTGLGLTVAQRLTQHMGGDIQVQSTLGIGSQFTVTLPFQRAEQSTATAPEASDFRNKRVLLVEDNPLNQLVAKRFLARMEITADLAENGQEALDRVAAAKIPYDAILMDIQMPVMDGLEAARRLREQFSGEALPIIAVSANTSDQDRDNCLSVGMNDFIPKPLDLSGLIRVLGFWLHVNYNPV